MKTILVAWLLAFGVVVSAHAQTFMYRGTIDAINPNTHTMVVHGTSVSREFEVPGDVQFVLKERSSPTFADLKVGDTVEVEYEMSDGMFTAVRVTSIGLKSH